MRGNSGGFCEGLGVGRGVTLQRVIVVVAVVLAVGCVGLAGATYWRNHTPGHLTRMADLALAQGDTDKAIAYLQEALRRAGNGAKGDVAAHARWSLATALIRAGREEDARGIISTELGLNPGDDEAVGVLMDSFVNPAERKYRAALRPMSAENGAEILRTIQGNLGSLAELVKAGGGRLAASARVDIARGELEHLYYTVYGEQVGQAKEARDTARDQVSLDRANERLKALSEPYGQHKDRAIAAMGAALAKDPKNALAGHLMAEYYLMDRQFGKVLEVAETMAGRNAETEEVLIDAANAVLADSQSVPVLSERFAKAQKLLEGFIALHPKSPRVLVALGQVVLERGDVGRAQDLARQALGASVNDLDAQLLQANCRLQLHQPGEALALITPMTNTFGNIPQVWYMLGQANSAAGNYQAAEDNYRKALSIVPTFVSARRGLLMNYLQSGNNEAADRLAMQIVRDDRYYIPAWQVRTETLRKAGQLDRITGDLGALAEDEGLPQESRADLVRLLAETGLSAQAEMLLRTLPGDMEKDSVLLRLRAEILASRGKTSDARLVLGRAVEAGPKDMAARLEYIDFLLRGNFSQDARGQLEAAAGMATTAEEFTRVGRGFLALNMAERAIEQAKRALTLRPHDVLAAGVLAEAASMNKSGADTNTLVQAISSGSNTSADVIRLGVLALDRKDYQQALVLARTGSARDSGNAELHFLAARALYGLGQQDNAANEILLGVKQAPQDMMGYDVLIYLFGNKKDAAKGMEHAGKLVAFNPVYAAYALGRLAAIDGQYDHAIRYYNDALDDVARVTNIPAAKEALYGAMLAAYGAKSDEAEYQKAVDRIAGDTGYSLMARVTAADHYLGLDQKGKAQEALTKLEAENQLTGQPTRVILNIAHRWDLVGDAGKVQAMLDRMTAAQKDSPEAHLFLADYYQQTNQVDKALAMRQQIVADNPGNPGPLANLALLEAATGDYPGAMATLKGCQATGQTGAFIASSVRVRLYAMLGLVQAASDELEASGKSAQKGDYQNALAIGEAWAELKKDGEARKFLGQVPTYANEYPQAQVRLAALSADEGKFDEALGILQKLTADADGPGRAMGALPRYQTLLRADKAPEALAWAEQMGKATAGQESRAARWTILAAEAAREARQFDRALELLAAARGAPDAPDTALDRTLIALLQGQPGKAWTAAEGVSDAGPAYGQSTLRLLSQPDAAVAAGIIKALGPDLANVSPSTLLAVLAASDPGQWKALAAGPMKATRMFRGDLEALAAELAGSRVPPATARQVVWKLALAQKLLEAGWASNALDVAEEARKSAPGCALAGVLRYEALGALARTEQAHAARDELIGKFGAVASVRLMAAKAAIDEHKYEQALAMFGPMLESEGQRTDLLTGMGQIYEHLGRLDEAIALNRKVREIFPEDISAANNLAYLLAQAKGSDGASLAEAHRQIEWAIGKAPNQTALLDTRGWIYTLEGQPEKGLESMRRAIVALRMYPAAHYHIGMAYARTGQLELARLHLENVGVIADPQEKVAEVDWAKRALEQMGRKELPTAALP